MEKRGLLAAEWGDELPEERGGPRRRYYTTTDDGKEVLKQSAERRQELINLTWVKTIDLEHSRKAQSK
jgi:DNA-binding PadR family transcriptional regulator